MLLHLVRNLLSRRQHPQLPGGIVRCACCLHGPIAAHTHTLRFHTPPHLLPCMYPYADRHAPSSLGRVASATIFAYMLNVLNVEERAVFCLRSNCSSIRRSCAHLSICTYAESRCGCDGLVCVLISGTVADRVDARGLGTEIERCPGCNDLC